MRRTPEKRSRSMATESSVEPLSATTTSATSDGVCATTDGRNFSSNFLPFQFKRMTDTFIDGFVNDGGKCKPRGQSAGRLRGGCGRQRSFLGTRPDLPGVPDGLYRGKEILLVPGQTSPASLMASTEARKFSWYPARLRRRPQPPRGLGNLQRRVLILPRPRKPSAACFGAFRGLGNVQRRVLTFSEASERLRGGCGRQRSISGTRQAWPASLTPRKGGKHAPQGVPRPSRLSLPPVIWYMDALRAIRYHV